MKDSRIRVSLFMRKPRPGDNYSIERLFDAVQASLPVECFHVTRLVCPYESKGLLRRIMIIAWAAIHQGDINHITGDVNFLGLLLKKSRTVLTIHDSASMHRLSGLRRKIYECLWLKMPISRAGMVTVISKSTLNETMLLTGVDSRKFRVVPCCITGGLKPQKKVFNTLLPRILQVGTKQNKNLLRVIEAIEGIPCLLAIVGHLDGDQERLLREHGISYENHINLDDNAMDEQYALADMVIFVSTYEGFGLPILEAQMVGRVVVTSNRSPMKEVAGAGAILVNPEDVVEIRSAVRRVIDSSSCRDELISAGHENIKRFMPKAIAMKYAAVYEELIAQQGCRQ